MPTTLVVPRGTSFQLNEDGSITIIGTGTGEMATISTGDIASTATGGTRFVVGKDGNIEVADESEAGNVFGKNESDTAESASSTWVVARQDRRDDSFSSLGYAADGNDCYDVFIQNPTILTALSITELRVLDPLHTSLLVKRGDAGDDFLSPVEAMDKWREPFAIPAGDRSARYLATVCASPASINQESHTRELKQQSSIFDFSDWFDVGRRDDKALGALQIKSNYDTMAISLRRADAMTLEREQIISGKSLGRKIANLNETLYDGESNSAVSSNQTLRTVPDMVALHFLSSAATSANASLDVVNSLPYPIKIMRASVSVEFGSNLTLLKGSDPVDVLKGVGIDLRIVDLGNATWKVIAPGRRIQNALSVDCTLDWGRFSQFSPHQNSVEFRGALILRASMDVELSFREWRKSWMLGKSTSTDVLLKIPLTIRIVRGMVGFLVQTTTHPLQEFFSLHYYNEEYDNADGVFVPLRNQITDFQLSSEKMMKLSSEYTKGMEHRFRVFNDLNTYMVVDTVELVGGNRDTTPNPSLCGRFDASVTERGVNEYINLSNLTNMGLVLVRYRFPVQSKTDAEESQFVLPSTCYLRVTTDPPSGTHEMSFLVYSGRLDITGERSHPNTMDTVNEDDDVRWHEIVLGFDNVVEWFKNSKSGYALHSILKASLERGNHYPMRDGVMLGRYLFNLAGRSMDLDVSDLSPILIKVGAIADGDTEILPLYMTNYNPTPLAVTIDVGEVEGMSISIGRDLTTGKGDGFSILDILPLRPVGIGIEGRGVRGRFRGHPLNALRQFLRKNDIVKEFFDRLPFRDDVYMDRSAVLRYPALKRLYREYAVARFHKSDMPWYRTHRSSTQCDSEAFPSLYGSFHKQLSLSGRKLLGPVIISCDRKTSRRLSVCSRVNTTANQLQEGSTVVIPPGGVARFDVRVRSPATRVLEKDITQFVATGLVLSTNLGEVLPIIVSFDALQGKLELSNLPSIEQHCNDCTQYVQHGVVRVPVRLFLNNPLEKRSSSILIPPHTARSLEEIASEAIVPRNFSFAESGVSLFIKSSFLRNMYLRKIVSCHPLFHITLVNETLEAEADPFLGVYIGSVTSALACDSVNDTPTSSSRFPSFFRCAISWLVKRSDLRPHGCGTVSSRDARKRLINDGENDDSTGIDNLIKSLKRAAFISEWSDELYSNSSVNTVRGISTTSIKSGRRNDVGVVSPMILDAVAGAWNTLQTAAEAGLLSIQTDLRAIVEYNATAEEISTVKQNEDREYEESSHLLSVAFHDISVQSKLEIPTLLSFSDSQKATATVAEGRFDSLQVVEFEPTLVANAKARKIRVFNPTAVPIRVRLATAPHLSGNRDDIRSSYLGSLPSPYVQSRRKLSVSPKDVAHHQWWDSGGAFFLPDLEGDMIRSHYNITIKSGIGGRISLVNPSFVGSVAFLVGCGSRCGLHSENVAKKNFESLINLTPTSPIGAAAAAGTSLVGREWPARSRIASVDGRDLKLGAGGSLISDGAGPSAFAIPYSALDEVIIPPFSGADMGPVYFRPPGRSMVLGCASMTNTIDNEKCKSQHFEAVLFLENSFSGLERIVLRGKALWEKIVFIDPFPDHFGDIELRNGHATLVFPGKAESFQKSTPLPVVKEVVVQNDGDTAVKIARVYLSHATKLHESHERDESAITSNPCELNHFRILGCIEPTGLSPISLLPGENHSIFVEHYPQCTKRKDFIALNVALNKQHNVDDLASADELFGWSSQFQNMDRTKARAALLRRQKFELLVGYEMSDIMLASCIPVIKPSGKVELDFAALSEFVAMRNNSFPATSLDRRLYDARKSRRMLFRTKYQVDLMVVFFTVLGVLGLVALLVQRLFPFRIDAKILKRSLRSPMPQNNDGLTSQSAGRNWTATIRCLARADPTSADLQSLEREQTRQIVLARLRSRGALPPQCFTSTGVASRERPCTGNSASRQATPGAPNGTQASSNDRVRKSEALFGKLRPKQSISKGCLPTELGWHAALTRGIIDSNALATWSSLELRTDRLLRLRENLNEAGKRHDVARGAIADEIDSFNDDSSGASSHFDSSIGETSDDVSEPQVCVQVPEVSVPRSISTSSVTVITSKKSVSSTQSATAITSGVGASYLNISPATTACAPDDSRLVVAPQQAESRAAKEEPLPIAKDNGNCDAFSSPQIANSRLSKEEEDLLVKIVPLVDRGATKEKECETAKESEAIFEKVNDAKQQTNKVADANTRKLNVKPSVKTMKKQNSKRPAANTSKLEAGKTTAATTKAEETNVVDASKLEKEDEKMPQTVVLPEHEPPSPRLLRPPPGLLPPPGFDGGVVQAAVLSVEDFGSPLESQMPPPPLTSHSTASADIFITPPPSTTRKISETSSSMGEAFLRAIHSENPGSASPVREMIALEEINLQRQDSDFDVMDFLDRILDEGNGSRMLGGDDAGAFSLGTAQSPVLPPTTGSSSGSPGPIAANPWASSYDSLEASRAAAYGIAWEHTADAPLLTPATIFASNVDEEQSANQKSHSFYADLLNQ